MVGNKGASGADLSALKIDEGARNNAGRGAKGRWLVGIAVAAVIVVIGAVVIIRGTTPVVAVAVARPAGDPRTTALLNASGYVTPRRRATIAAKITARVVDVYVDEGMEVTEGQLLARLDDSDALKRLAAAQTQRAATAAQVPNLEINLANADREMRRQQDLERDGVSSVQALDLARTTADSLRAQIAAAQEQVKAADAQIGVARQDLENCTVRAPFSGIVVSKDAQRGEMVSPISAGGGFTRTGIATIVDMGSLEIEVDVNEAYIARVTSGQRVTATLDAYPEWQIPCKVRTVIPTADRQKATVKVRISFEKLDPRILPDMGVKVGFLGDQQSTGQAQARALVPKDAIREADGKQVVLLVHDGLLERRAVSVGAAIGSDVEVTAGVAPGDQVVVNGPGGLHDGQRVKVR